MAFEITNFCQLQRIIHFGIQICVVRWMSVNVSKVEVASIFDVCEYANMKGESGDTFLQRICRLRADYMCS